MCLRQEITIPPIEWGGGSPTAPLVVVGDPGWSNYQVSTDALLEGTGYLELIGRLGRQAESSPGASQGYHLRATNDGNWSLFKEDINGEIIVLTATNLDNTIKIALESAQNGKEVTLLSTGDPGFSGILRTVQKRNFAAAIEINVIPGISSIQASAAKLAISWDQACLFTFHEGQVSAEEKNKLAACASKGKIIMLLPDPKSFPPKEIASFLIKAGLDKTTPVYICEKLTLNDEKITSSTLEKASKLSFESLAVMVIKSNR